MLFLVVVFLGCVRANVTLSMTVEANYPCLRKA